MTFGLFALSKNLSHPPFEPISVIDVVIPYKTNTRILLGVNTPNVCNTDPRVVFAFTTIQWAQQKRSGWGWLVGYK